MKLSELVKKMGVELEIPVEQDKEVEGFIPIERFNEVNNQKKVLEEQLKQQEENTKELKELAGKSKENKEKILEYEKRLEEQKQEYERKTLELKKDSIVQNELLKHNAKHPDLLISKINKELIQISESGEVIGINEQITKVKETYPELFGEKTLKTPQPNGGSAEPTKNPFSKEHFNVTEQMKLFKENPELAKKLQASAK